MRLLNLTRVSSYPTGCGFSAKSIKSALSGVPGTRQKLRTARWPRIVDLDLLVLGLHGWINILLAPLLCLLSLLVLQAQSPYNCKSRRQSSGLREIEIVEGYFNWRPLADNLQGFGREFFFRQVSGENKIGIFRTLLG